jgi:hypothetical protein
MFVPHVPVLIFRMRQKAKMAYGTEAGIPADLGCSHYTPPVIIHVMFRARDGDRGSCINFHTCPIVMNHWDASAVAGVQAAARLT